MEKLDPELATSAVFRDKLLSMPVWMLVSYLTILGLVLEIYEPPILVMIWCLLFSCLAVISVSNYVVYSNPRLFPGGDDAKLSV